MDLLIEFTSVDGETREERWRSVDAFRSWAVAQGISGIFTAYRADDDGEWVVVEKGRVGAPPLSRPPHRPR